MTAANAHRPTLVLAALLSTLLLPPFAFAHKGGIDPYGCHPDDKAGGYHCHQGILAGLNFPSRGAMLRAVDDAHESPSNPPVRPPASPPAFEALRACSVIDARQEQRACFDRITRPRE
jgi:hypothetical protein